jgi:D-glycero-alpha-D-manno-heptose 1-phosphate guanylyltransferase
VPEILPDAVILAGGLGTRLRSVISDLPKPMAPVNGKPFLCYVLEYCQKQGISHAVLSVGYKGHLIREYFGNHFRTQGLPGHIKLSYSFEESPLGTGGGIRLAMDQVISDPFYVLNGDTWFNVNLKLLLDQHIAAGSKITLSLKELSDFDRYGTVETSDNRVISFREKQPCTRGLINGGIYCMRKESLEHFEPGSVFSFEKDVLEKSAGVSTLTGFTFPGYFIDIGIPGDYAEASSVFGI